MKDPRCPLRLEAAKKDLAYVEAWELCYWFWRDKPNYTAPHYFVLDLQMGPLYAHPDAAKIRELVEVADSVTGRGYYDYRELLALLAKREELAEFDSAATMRYVTWRSPHIIAPLSGVLKDNKKYVTLRTWLSDNGQPWHE